MEQEKQIEVNQEKEVEKEVKEFEKNVKKIINPYRIKFKKPYEFEGAKYEEVDLSGLNNLTTKDLIEADKEFAEMGQYAMMNELTIGYAAIVAAKASGKPVEFFINLPASSGVKVKNIVMGFLGD